ncbi:Chemotaxis protein CheC OS=Stutzerimonas stutzeri OX=316 GN=UIB01_10890 PE=4 SV=1 [Stutzerimonas stutzeri]
MARLLRRQDDHEIEMLLDLGLLISACLSGIADQIDVAFSQGHPQVLGQHAPMRS